MPTSRIDAFLFDFGGVVVSIDFQRAFAAWAAAAGAPVAALAARFTFDAHYEAHECGTLDSARYFESLRTSLGVALADEVLLAGWNEIFLEPMPGIAALLRSLAQQRPLYLFSNTNRAHHACWSRQYRDVLAPFSGIFCSHELGLRKPSVESFEAVAARAGVPVERMVFFDDLDENVRGARAAGLQAFHVTTTGEIERVLAQIGFAPDGGARTAARVE
jgi:putative hydrolase of the HAD superfamily